MTIRTFPKIYSAISVAQSTDVVMYAFPLPAGATINQGWMDISLMFPDVDVSSAIHYSIFGYVVPILDLDAGTTPDVIWDNQIPKDSVDDTADSLDIDLHTADTSPVLELGDVNINAILDFETGPQLVFKKEEILTFPKSPFGFKTGTPDTYYAMSTLKAKLKRNLRVQVPSYYLVGVGVSDAADTATAFPVINTRGEWMQLAYMKDALVDAMKSMAGLSIVGTQEPYSEAMILIHSYLEHVHETNAAQWGTGTLEAWGKMTMDITLPGDFDVAQLSGSA